MRIKHGTAQKSPQIHKIAAASCCWEKLAAGVVAMPGIPTMADAGPMVYQALFVNSDIAMAIMSISSMVTATMKNWSRRRP